MNQIAFFKIYLINKQEMAIPIEIRRENLILDESIDHNAEKIILNYICERLKNTLKIVLPWKNSDLFCKGLETLCFGKCILKVHDIECILYDIYKLNQKIQQIIELSQQQKQLKAKIKINDMRINLKINRNNEPFCDKTEITEAFFNIFDIKEKSTDKNYVKLLEDKIRDLEFKLELSLTDYQIEGVSDYSEIVLNEIAIDYKLLSDDYNERLSIKKLALAQNKILSDKEWDAMDVKLLKAKCQKKLKKIAGKKIKIGEQELTMRKKNIDLEKEKNSLEKQKSLMESQKIKLQNQTQIKIHALKTFVADVRLYLNYSIDSEENQSLDLSTIDTEISNLKEDLKKLEAQYKSKNNLNNKTIETQMEHIKTQLTSYRSLKVLQTSPKPYKSITNSASPTFMLDKNLSPNALHRKKFNFNIVDLSGIKNEEDNELRKYLRVKELRIKDREEEVYTNEQRALNFWINTLEHREIIINVQKALTDLKKSKEKYENRIEFYEKKKFELQNRLDEIIRRENEISNSKEELANEKDSFEQEKRVFLGKINALLKVIE